MWLYNNTRNDPLLLRLIYKYAFAYPLAVRKKYLGLSIVSCVAVEKYVNYVVAVSLTEELYMKYSNVSGAVVELILG